MPSRAALAGAVLAVVLAIVAVTVTVTVAVTAPLPPTARWVLLGHAALQLVVRVALALHLRRRA